MAPKHGAAKRKKESTYRVGKICELHPELGGKRYASNHACPECRKARHRVYYHVRREEICKQNVARHREEPRLRMLSNARKRSSSSGRPFDLTLADIPDIPSHCPILGIELFCGEGKATDNSPTLDCIIPERGYTSSNVQVISQRANRIKNDATPEELWRVAEFVMRQVSERRKPVT